MKRCSMKEIAASLPAEKRKADGPWTNFVLRPLSFPATWLFLRLGFSPNGVTYLSVLVCVAGFAFLLVPSAPAVYVAFLLFLLFGVLDCADGNMARVSEKKNPWGEWVDALGGYVAYTAFLLGIGMSCELSSGAAIPAFPALNLPWPRGGWMLVGALAASANLLMRAVFQNYRALRPEEGRAGVGAEKKLSETIGITGFLVPLSALSYAFGLLPFVLCAYAAIYGGGASLVILKLVRKVERDTKGIS